jgi:hypothetical protein
VAVVPCYPSSLLTMPVLGSLACEWLWYFLCVSSLLTIPVYGFLVSEWLWCLAVLLAC